MLMRPVCEIERLLQKDFYIERYEDIQQFKGYDTQRIWYLKKRPLIWTQPELIVDEMARFKDKRHWYCFRNKVHISCNHLLCKTKNENFKATIKGIR